MGTFASLLIIVLVLPGILSMTLNEKKVYQDVIKDGDIPSFWLRLLNHVIIVVPFAILGLFFYEREGFDIQSIQGLNINSVSISLLCALINVAAYYLFFKRRVSLDTFTKAERSRTQLGIWTRIFYGGVVEEVIFRFGLMSFLVWLFNLFITNTILSVWLSNLLASILFALAHLPGVYQMKVSVTKTVLIYTNGMNIIVGLTCGWLYWKEGLAAAVMCHMIFHLVWYVFEKLGKRTVKALEM
ncbi:CPBP family intramembrane glutamic endopeptidase [Bacillus sp. 31A1R]|uniref:CPBP family intramembrane glutamic endopeptidase n=1 Tax=Robertmurraya mangrovi TaxID=3098077 RepID=A0ABU5J0F0_9BACI|nr:CPBP family intramembrane glutamic endopeptidase [Bacillus sp. 31A1R]MDZ5472825.1 CPBP family intramembrane glutamic endopeptidase [Bacillus sp. 31A1R]